MRPSLMHNSVDIKALKTLFISFDRYNSLILLDSGSPLRMEPSQISLVDLACLLLLCFSPWFLA